MGTASVHKSWRKAYGAIKDSATVGLAKVNSGGRDHKDLDVAVVKATTHVERPPKERHLAAIFTATSSSRSLADVSYCVHALARRLSKTRNWVVALKTLIVIHRTLRDGDAAFREELLSYRRRGHALQMSNFKDDSSPLAWDCSAWVRTYALYLEERLECFRVLRYDIESERLRPVEGNAKGQSRTRSIGKDDLLEQLPALQQLLFRLVGCQVENSFSLLTCFGGNLPETEEELQFAAEEEDEPETPTTADLLGLHEVNPAVAALEESNALALAIVPPGKFQETETEISATFISDMKFARNRIRSCCAGGSNTPAIGFGEITGSSGWELTLVTAPTTSTSSQLTDCKLAGGFDKLLLDSLYDDAAWRQQATADAYGNGQVDPFAMSNGVAPPTGVQMSMMAQQQQFQAPYNGAAASQFHNPFGDAYSVVPFHGSSSLI
ncbi:hypothetical protein PR202_ga14480 [Eleusine coracana subsp. coracana]|uniref:ENTH domain-containing protein n=1 Tax=Eleusine coracana subsp. coracana TaxID=191504 RepID=A0AAV5CHP6_ELECO|nr:hypothetical protein PR202_ga14480 [Eleusine coracana subsp. coracana]